MTDAPLRVWTYEPAWRRVMPELAGIARAIEPALLGRDGRPVGAPPTDFEVAWASPEIYIDGHLRAFFDVVAAAPGLRWVQSGSVGYDHPLLRAVIARGVAFSVNSAPSASIAECVFTGVLDHFQQGPRRRAAQAARRWEPLPYREIAGTTWLVIGVGGIGGGVATRARAFGASVLGVSRSGASLPGVDETHRPDRILDLLPRADVVVLALPLSATTERLVDDRFLEAMKPGSVLVNVARGGIVDDAALLRALARGTPAHAVLDVFTTEPLPPDSPHWDHPRVALTAHLAGMGSGLIRRSDELFIDNLRRYVAGVPPAGLVSRPAEFPA